MAIALLSPMKFPAPRAPFSKDAAVRGEVRRAPLGGPVGFSSAFLVDGLEPPLPRLALYF